MTIDILIFTGLVLAFAVLVGACIEWLRRRRQWLKIIRAAEEPRIRREPVPPVSIYKDAA
jgi:hypothetical protein